ncbi:uncharacterized protein LOC132287102 [Cornus florida]|uniref:uncharacterized protein LOC132287102 n=1 Tax=Cornus florida TaxID=4283 RepID=UPI0028A0796F|nr:uncharacterized protein LOC132287102 [Cornus florida]
MASPKLVDEPPPPSHYYHPLPPNQHHQNYVVLPLYLPAVVRRRQWSCRLLCTAALLLAAVAVYSLWPSDPDLEMVRFRLERIQFHTEPTIAIDIALNLTLKVRNRDLYSMDYRSLEMAIGYRGKNLGFVTSDYGHVRAMGSSYVDARLDLDGVEVFSDVILLLEDLARGSVPFDTVTVIRGRLGLFFLDLPLEAKISCEVYVNTRNQTIVRQNCYPE